MTDDARPGKDGAAAAVTLHAEHAEGAAAFRAVRLSPERVVVPPDCACCGALASRSVRESRFGTKDVVLVPYCGACHAHFSRARTDGLSAAVSSGLLALTLSAGLPLLWQPPSVPVYALIAALGSAFPLAVRRLRRKRPDPGHAAKGRAAFWNTEGALVCASPDWGTRLALGSQAESAETRAHEPSFPGWALAFPLLAVLAAMPLYRLHFSLVRVVNVTRSRLSIAVDGRDVARVDPTSAESVTAGVALRVPAGRRKVTATDPAGHLVEAATVFVEAGTEHLYAPASGETCFWLETTPYGRGKVSGTVREPLSATRTFWPLPRDIDFWFASAPSSDDDDRSSGGFSTALRQARCDEAPEDVRSGHGFEGGTPP